MRFAVTVVSPPGYVHSAAFHEVAEMLHYGLKACGHDSVLTKDGQLTGRRHIVLGANLLPRYPLPLAPDAILYNLEQVQRGSSWISPEMVAIFKRYTTWDYSPQNVERLAELGVRVAATIPVGYVPELTRIHRSTEPDIDVLFFGSWNERRQMVVDQMRALGLHVECLFGVYGSARDAVISRSKLILNVHFYDAKVLEMVRISYLLANHCAVLSEHSADLSEDAALQGGVAFADFEQLAQTARALVDSPDDRERIAAGGFELIRGRPVTAHLEAALKGLRT